LKIAFDNSWVPDIWNNPLSSASGTKANETGPARSGSIAESNPMKLPGGKFSEMVELLNSRLIGASSRLFTSTEKCLAVELPPESVERMTML
jgi:hypothetical protein